ncbi:MAG TPA: hypothetical protein VKB10_03010 [Gaiellaceae bacterium]|nr:hypothetical protein [Gaiellaceae bacterium]
MRQTAAATPVRREQQASATPRRIWRVFEYRRPVAARRVRFTT